MADPGPELTVSRSPSRQKAVPSAFKRSVSWRDRVVL